MILKGSGEIQYQKRNALLLDRALRRSGHPVVAQAQRTLLVSKAKFALP